MNALLSTRSLNISIAGKQVCNQLDLDIRNNQCWAILGANGIGKSTLLHTLAGLRPADGGDIKYLGQHINQIPSRHLAKTRAVLFQNQLDPFPATVSETVAVGRHPYLSTWQWYSNQDDRIVEHVLEQVGMLDFSDRIISSLSGGERQRISIAATLAQTPQLFLLDEPTNHLDLPHQIKMLELLTQQKNETTAVVMILHDVNLAARFCDHVLMLFGNGEVKTGASDRLMNTETLSELYRHPLKHIKGELHDFYLPQ